MGFCVLCCTCAVEPVSPEPLPAAVTSAPAPPPALPPEQPVATPAEPSTEDVTFLAFGDMILTHRVGRAVAGHGDTDIPFTSLAELLHAVDFNYANLEAPLAADTPLDGLLKFRFRVLNLANNHIMDGGLERLLLTVQRLRDAGIATTGVGPDLAAAWAPQVVAVRGVRVAFVGASYTSKNSSRAVRLPYVARIDQPWDARKAIAAAREQADFVVAAMHAGTEYIRFPAAEQTHFARLAIESGADLVIGTHPHVVQKVERYRGKLIFHSLGNFVFDQDRPPEVHESAAVRVSLSVTEKRLRAVEVVPLVNLDTLTPQVADAPRAEAILRRMGLTSPTLVTPEALPQAATPPK